MSKGRIGWTKYPNPPPAYSDWKVTFTLIGEAQSDQLSTDISNGDPNIASRKDICHSETYHVHKCLVGPMSEYFDMVYQHSFKESHTQESCISFPSALGEESFNSITISFEVYLNYCYLFAENDGTFDGIVNKLKPPVLGLCFVQDYFQFSNPQDRKLKVQFDAYLACFIEQGTSSLIKLCKDIVYFQAASLSTPSITESFLAYCYDHPVILRPRRLWSKQRSQKERELTSKFPLHTLLELDEKLKTNSYQLLPYVMNLHLWKQLVDKIKMNPTSESISKKWSTNIAYFVQIYGTDIALGDFQHLSDEAVLPHIEPIAAIIFLKYEKSHAYQHEVTNQNEKQAHHDDNTTTSDSSSPSDTCNEFKNDTKGTKKSALTNLQLRCIDSLVLADLDELASDKIREHAIAAMDFETLKEYTTRNYARTCKRISEFC